MRHANASRDDKSPTNSEASQPFEDTHFGKLPAELRTEIYSLALIDQEFYRQDAINFDFGPERNPMVPKDKPRYDWNTGIAVDHLKQSYNVFDFDFDRLQSSMTRVCHQMRSETRIIFYASHSFILHLPYPMDNTYYGTPMKADRVEAIARFASSWLESLGSDAVRAMQGIAITSYPAHIKRFREIEDSFHSVVLKGHSFEYTRRGPCYCEPYVEYVIQTLNKLGVVVEEPSFYFEPSLWTDS